MRASVTRAAKDFERRRFTVEEMLRMQEAGIISGTARRCRLSPRDGRLL